MKNAYSFVIVMLLLAACAPKVQTPRPTLQLAGSPKQIAESAIKLCPTLTLVGYGAFSMDNVNINNKGNYVVTCKATMNFFTAQRLAERRLPPEFPSSPRIINPNDPNKEAKEALARMRERSNELARERDISSKARDIMRNEPQILRVSLQAVSNAVVEAVVSSSPRHIEEQMELALLKEFSISR